MRIFLVRHGESLANLDKNIHSSYPDHAIPLSDKGKEQAKIAGLSLSSYLMDIDGNDANTSLFDKIKKVFKNTDNKSNNIRIWSSPYKRTRETAYYLLKGLEINVSFMRKYNISFRENNRLCEQQFGLFDGIDDHDYVNKFPIEGNHYNKSVEYEGKYWARMPLGESRFDVSNRVQQVFGAINRDKNKHNINTIIVICHGITMRAFIQEWLHLSPEWFDAEPNPDNCWIRLLSNEPRDLKSNDSWNDLGYIFTGKERPDLWNKKYIVKSKPCNATCLHIHKLIKGYCSDCKLTETELHEWDTYSTQQKSKILSDINTFRL